MGRLFVSSCCVLIGIHLVEVKFLRCVSVAEKIKAQTPWIQLLVARTFSIGFHCCKEGIGSILFDLDTNEHCRGGLCRASTRCLERPISNGRCLNFCHGLTRNPSCRLEVCPGLIMVSSFVLGRHIVVNISFIENEFVSVISVTPM